MSDDKDSSMPSRSCQITKCFLEVSKSSTISEEKYLRKQLVIYDRQKHGPLQYEEATKNKTWFQVSQQVLGRNLGEKWKSVNGEKFVKVCLQSS